MAALTGVRGRVLHAECGNGTLLDALVEAGIDAYGVDPDEVVIEAAIDRGLDVRRESIVGHLDVVADEALSGLVLTGSIQWLHPNQRDRLVMLATTRLAVDGVLVIHSATRHAWEGDAAPPEADLAPGRPLRPASWRTVLVEHGYETIEVNEGEADYLVTAVRYTLDAPGAPGTPAGR